MADTKLFNIKGTVKEYQSGTVTLEKELQTVIENNMNIFFGVTFLASEYRTTDGGRMDSIGIDENHCPVIFEYKRSVKENVINQGLFYLNWLLDHKDSFKVLVIEKLGLKAANNIDWSMPRVVCVAGDFTKYDESAIKQMNRNISLIRYKKFGEDLLMFEQVNENVVSAIPDNEPVSKTKATDKTFDEQIRNADENIRVLYENLSNYILSLGDDISESHLKLYAAFKKIRNVVTVVAQKKKLILNLPLDVSTVSFEEGFSRDVTNIGHWGCGAVELYLQSGVDFEKAKPLIDRAFRAKIRELETNIYNAYSPELIRHYEAQFIEGWQQCSDDFYKVLKESRITFFLSSFVSLVAIPFVGQLLSPHIGQELTSAIQAGAPLLNIGIGYFDYRNKISPAKADGGFSYIIKANRDGIIHI